MVKKYNYNNIDRTLFTVSVGNEKRVTISSTYDNKGIESELEIRFLSVEDNADINIISINEYYTDGYDEITLPKRYFSNLSNVRKIVIDYLNATKKDVLSNF